MSELHWTGAAVLLALAVLSRESARPRPAKTSSWADLAPVHDLDAEPQPTSDEPLHLATVRARRGRPRGAQTRQVSWTNRGGQRCALVQ
jgi:hypothetical protein